MCGFTANKPVIMVTGGSLGAEKVNKLVRAALPELLKDFQKQTKNGTGVCTTTYYFICFDGIWKYGRRCGCNGTSWRSINWCGNGIFAISHQSQRQIF